MGNFLFDLLLFAIISGDTAEKKALYRAFASILIFEVTIYVNCEWFECIIKKRSGVH